MGLMQERITSTKNGSMQAIQAIYVPEDDLTDSPVQHSLSHLDANNCLEVKDRIRNLSP